MKQELFNLGNVLNTSSDLKTAKLNQSRKQLLQDTINMENEAYGNFIAKDNPNAMVQPVDSNKDGTIDAGEQRQATMRTGMKMNALNDVENLRNKRSDRATAAQNRKQIQANRSERMNWARQDRKAKKEESYAALQSTVEMMKNTGSFSPEQIKAVEDGNLKIYSAVQVAADKNDKKAIENYQMIANVNGEMSSYMMEQAGKGRSSDELKQDYTAARNRLPEKIRKNISKTAPVDGNGQVTKESLGVGLITSNMLAKVADNAGLTPGQVATNTRAENRASYTEKRDKRRAAATKKENARKYFVGAVENDPQIEMGAEARKIINRAQEIHAEGKLSEAASLSKAVEENKFTEGNIYTQNGVKYKYEDRKFNKIK